MRLYLKVINCTWSHVLMIIPIQKTELRNKRWQNLTIQGNRVTETTKLQLNLDIKYIERIYQMSYSSLSDNGMYADN